jgi:hypothetical protein
MNTVPKEGLRQFFGRLVRFGLTTESPRDRNVDDLIDLYEEFPNLFIYSPTGITAPSPADYELMVGNFVLSHPTPRAQDFWKNMCSYESFSSVNPLQDVHFQPTEMPVKVFRKVFRFFLGHVAGSTQRMDVFARGLGGFQEDDNIFSILVYSFVKLVIIFSIRIAMCPNRSASRQTCTFLKHVLDRLTGFDDGKMTKAKDKCSCKGRTYHQLCQVFVNVVEREADEDRLHILALRNP